jgi:pteridine reductase
MNPKTDPVADTETNTDEGEHPVALVTGAGADRVGRCIAQTLSAHGYRTVLHANRSVEQAREVARELSSTGPESIAVAADLQEAAEITQMVDQALDHFGRIDALVNCAAIWQSKPLEEIQIEDLRLHLDVNTVGTFLCCQKVGLRMVDQPSGGAIVNLGDWAVSRPYRNYAAYFPSKGAIGAITRSLAVELGLRNPRVRVNAVLPGPVMLPEDMPPEEREAAIAQTLVQREGSADHVAHAVLFLLENDFVTGVCLPVDGGRSIYGVEPAHLSQ